MQNEKQVSNYVTEANELLQKMNVTFKAVFIENANHFDDDAQTRDIFRATFIRNDLKTSNGRFARFSLRFGQSIKESDYNGGNPPTAYDVLTCIQKYDVGSFENFCGDFGYDTDSRKAHKTYKAVCKEWEQVNKFFTSDELEQLQEVQ